MASKITVGKIVANATPLGWSQAYHAGGFTAVISLTAQEGEKENELQAKGKELLDTLVAEYFTLTTKDLETVKTAVETTIAKTPKEVSVGLVVAAVVKNVLYVVIANAGKVLLKRGEKLGMLLSVNPQDQQKIASVSGFLEAGDMLLLFTSAFSTIFTHEELEEAFAHPTAEDVAEFIAPKVHNAGKGDASALVFSYHDEEVSPAETIAPKPEPTPESVIEKPQEHDLPGFEKPLASAHHNGFSHRQRLFLTLTAILGIVLLGSIVLFLWKQQQAKEQALFQSIYTPAQSKYNDAKGLMDVNKTLAIADLQDAAQILSSGKDKLPAGSSDQKQVITLLSQVQSTLTDAKKIPLLTAQTAPDGASALLSFAKNHSGMYVTQDTADFYAADNTSVTQYDKKTNASKKLITNTNDWKQIGGFDTYFGNMYILDTKDGIDKYSSGSFSKSAYFASGVSPDLSKAVSMSIDSSVYILTSDGTITKYTKGASDTFSLTGLDTPLKNPTEILTSADLSNVYVLDAGNSRIVVLSKDGAFIAQYASDPIHQATTIDVSEKNKKLYFLSSGTIYQLDMK